MLEIRNGSAQLVIASPPFTNQSNGKTLDKKDYLNFIQRVIRELGRALKPGGVLVTINTDLRDHSRYNRGDKRFDGLIWQKHSDLRALAEDEGLRCIDTKIWAKSLKRNIYRYSFAYLQFFQKPGASLRRRSPREIADRFDPDVWLLEKGMTRRDSRGFVFRDAIHPEIVKRCLERFTSTGDLVISPFAGSGTILSVANLMGRRCVGYEINRELKVLIEESIRTPQSFSAYQQLSNLVEFSDL